MNRSLYLFAILVSGFVSCTKDKIVAPNQAQTIVLNSFPLTIGHSWKYHTDVHVDSAGINFSNSSLDNFWTVVSDSMINGILSTKISQRDSNFNGTEYQAFTFYANEPNGFYGMAVEEYGSMFFLRSIPGSGHFMNSYMRISNLAGVDSLYVPDSSLWFLKFPSSINDQWHTVRYGTTGSFYQTRMYDSFQTITNSAGTFDCVKVKIYFENNGQPDTALTVYQYFSDKGLIREEQSGYLLFAGGGSGFFTQTTTLTQVNF